MRQSGCSFHCQWAVITACLFVFLSVFVASLSESADDQTKLPQSMVERMNEGLPQDVLVLLDDSKTQTDALPAQQALGVGSGSRLILSMKAAGFDNLKLEVLSDFAEGELMVLRDYHNLPILFARVSSLAVLRKLAEDPRVVRVYEDQPRRHFLAESLPLIRQPEAVVAGGSGGAGTTVAILDTGVDYTRPEFGSCTAPGDPESCVVVHEQDFAPDDFSRDDDGHGTNVAGIVTAVAPEARIAALDVFSGQFAWDSDIMRAVDWCIENREVFNIAAMNMSFGRGAFSSSCPQDSLAIPIRNAMDAGIITVVASGNDAYVNRISSPACVPESVSVGAVYDSDLGAKFWSNCYDRSTYSDKVTCFSNSSPFLTLLAPGAVITAAGKSMSGTSQAAAHVSGAIAVLRGEWAAPREDVGETIARLVEYGLPIVDHRNGIAKSRVDVRAALGSIASYTISGSVMSGGVPLPNATVNLMGGVNRTAVTDAYGNYFFDDLLNGNYLVKSVKAGYAFSPDEATVTIAGSDISGIDFIGTYQEGKMYAISGNVRRRGWRTSPGAPIMGVTITLAGRVNGVVTTDANGDYLFPGIPNGTYTVTPEHKTFSFMPLDRTVSLSDSDLLGQDFVGSETSLSTR